MPPPHPASRSRRRAPLAAAALLLPVLAGGCGRRDAGDVVEVAPGVTFRRDRAAGVQLLDIDLATAKVRPVVVAENVERVRNNFVADAHTVREWAQKYGAVAGVNGGFFGDTYDDLGRRKQIVGLAAVGGKMIAPGGFVSPSDRPDVRLLRSAVGFGGAAGGVPSLAWATGTAREPLRAYPDPVNPRGRGETWQVRDAVACGPRLFAGGARRITDREERLVDKRKVQRAFVAYDRENGRPRHLVLGRADAMEYADLASYLSDYYARVHNETPHEAMCLDGGPSAQVVYKNGPDGPLEDAEPTGVLVPTAILFVPEK